MVSGMRAVMLDVPRQLLEERRRLGLDRWDEVWEGELHMVPPPHGDHGCLNDELGVFFKLHWERLGLGRTFLETGVRRRDAGPLAELQDRPSDYRTPDRAFLLPGRFDRYQDGWIVGGPDAVLEIESPGDESRQKLPFYLAIGVREVLLVHRVTRQVEVLRATEPGYVLAAPDPDGWVRSQVLRTAFRTQPGGSAAGDEQPPALLLRRWDEPGRELRIG